MKSSIRKKRDNIDIPTFWDAIGYKPSGIALVTADGENGPGGFLALSTAHVSANPPTMLVSIEKKTSALKIILESNHFAINILPLGTEELANLFTGKGGLKGADRFDPELWTIMTTGAPIYSSAIMAMDCIVEEVFERKGVSIVIGQVIDLLINQDQSAMIYYKGKYRSLPEEN